MDDRPVPLRQRPGLGLAVVPHSLRRVHGVATGVPLPLDASREASAGDRGSREIEGDHGRLRGDGYHREIHKNRSGQRRRITGASGCLRQSQVRARPSFLSGINGYYQCNLDECQET